VDGFVSRVTEVGEQDGLGVHVIEDPHAPFGVVIMVVNGMCVYEGTYVPDGALALAWRKLDGPSRGRALFLTDAMPLIPELRSVADLEEANHYTIDDVRVYIGKLVQLYRTGWRTLNTDLDAVFLAYYQAAFSAPHLSPSKVHLELVGQHSSGKSTALSTFCGGQFPHLQICPWAKGLVNYSPASIYQGFNRASVTMGLEEFTRDLTIATAKTAQVQSINELLRQVIFPGGAVISRALPSGGSRQMVVRTNVVTASIHPAHDPQDASRRLTIETVKVEGLKDPQMEFTELFPPEELSRMRRVLGLGLIKFYRPYREHYEKIERELGTGKVITSFAVDTRFLRNFYPIAPLMALLGEDWKDFVVKATEARRGRLTANARSNVTTQLFDTLFRTNNLRIGQSGAITSVAVMLGSKDPTRWLALNHAQAGVYYFEDLGYLIIDWISVVAPGGLLHRVEPYCRTPPNLLKHQLDQHPLAQREHQYEPPKVLGALRAFGGVMRTDEITVVDVSKVVTDLRESFVERLPSADRDRPGGAADDGPPGLPKRNRNLNNNL
jgi:GTPase SAR1 family protein